MDNQQPGPSGYKSNDSKSQKRSRKNKSRDKTKEKKKPKPRDRRLSSFDGTKLRYKVIVRPEGTQASNTVKNLNLPSTSRYEAKPTTQKRIIVHEMEPRVSNDQDAVDNYLRAHVHRRESLMNMHQHVSKHKHVEISRERFSRTDSAKNIIRTLRRCRECHEFPCVCVVDETRPYKTDWGVLVSPLKIDGRMYKDPSFKWFLDLEKSSVVNKKELLNRKIKAQNDLWTLPFLWKREIEAIDFYLAH